MIEGVASGLSVIGASVSEPPPGGVNAIFALYIYIYIRSYVRTSSCTVTRATRKREAGLITSVEIASATKRERNETLRCCARETGDRTEKTSCQYVDVCRRVRNHLSSLKARENLAYVQ